MGHRQPLGLDFGAILIFGAAMGAPAGLLADVVSTIEPIILEAWTVEDRP